MCDYIYIYIFVVKPQNVICMKKILFILVLLFAIIPIRSYCQNDSNWDRIGKIYVTKPSSSNAYKEAPDQLAYLYGKFDGENMSYKIYVPADNCSYTVRYNQSYNKSKVDYCNEQSSKYDNFKGPWPMIIEKYPQVAGPYYLNVANSF